MRGLARARRRSRGVVARHLRRLAVAAGLAGSLTVPGPLTPAATAAVLVDQQTALSEAFPGAEVTRRRVFLSEEEAERVEELCRCELRSRIVLPYEAVKDGRLVGTAYFDAHVVRTLPEVLMLVVEPSGAIGRVEVLSFDEPPDYLPPDRWLEQLEGKTLADELQLKRGIAGITGATLSSRAATSAARRTLALHRLLGQRERQREREREREADAGSRVTPEEDAPAPVDAEREPDGAARSGATNAESERAPRGGR